MVVGRDRRDLRVGHRDLRVERSELQVLLVLLGAVVPPGEREDERVLALDLAQAAQGPGVIGQLVVGERAAGCDIGTHGVTPLSVVDASAPHRSSRRPGAASTSWEASGARAHLATGPWRDQGGSRV